MKRFAQGLRPSSMTIISAAMTVAIVGWLAVSHVLHSYLGAPMS